LAEACGRVVTVEDGCATGGFGSFISSHLPSGSVLETGIPDEFQPHASREELMLRMGLDPETLADRIGDFIGS
ncbi:MAG: transketolase C-terminal domain-containing protein, partial [Candidatus Fermentibacteria bacterium]